MKDLSAVVKFAEIEEILEKESDEESEEHIPAEGCIIRDTCSCSAMPFCCMNLSAMKVEMEAVEVSNAHKLRYLKQLLLAQEGGISVEYRCVKCEDCWSCKNADSTEKLSLREEQEDQLIRDSVTLNFSTNNQNH